MKTTETGLFYAAQKGLLDQIQRLANPTNANIEGPHGWTPVIVSASWNHALCVKELIKREADPNDTTIHGVTTLSYAASYGYTEVVKTLCKNGADVDATDYAGRTAIGWASYRGHYETVKLVVDEFGANPLIGSISNFLKSVGHSSAGLKN